MNRRDFLKLSVGGVATLVVGSRLSWLHPGQAYAAAPGQTLQITVTDAIKEMVTHNAINTAECYFWGFQMSIAGAPGTPDTVLPYECPSPTILIENGDSITVEIHNELDEPHAFFVPGIFDSGTDAVDITDNTTTYPNGIPPGKTVRGTFTPGKSGAFLYYDNLNEPVNRMMGLHGALIVRPRVKAVGHKFTPYDPADVTPGVQALYDDFGSSNHFPGLAWEEGDPATNVPPFRQYVWVTHQASPNLFKKVGSLPPGEIYPAAQFVNEFLHSPFDPTNATSDTPQYFTINGQSGMFAHMGPNITPIGRVGEPVVVHILNAGLWTHSMHLHANHFYVTSLNGEVSENPIWVDVYNVRPMDRVDYTIPFMRCPDIPNVRGIGYPDKPLTTLNGHPCWPPAEELNLFIPAAGERLAADIHGNTIDLKQRLSPLCYPMHDHSEPSQTAQGGNYNCGLISGMYITGDRNTPGYMDFPMDHDFAMMYRNIRGCSLGTNPSPGFEPPPHGT